MQLRVFGRVSKTLAAPTMRATGQEARPLAAEAVKKRKSAIGKSARNMARKTLCASRVPKNKMVGGGIRGGRIAVLAFVVLCVSPSVQFMQPTPSPARASQKMTSMHYARGNVRLAPITLNMKSGDSVNIPHSAITFALLETLRDYIILSLTFHLSSPSLRQLLDKGLDLVLGGGPKAGAQMLDRGGEKGIDFCVVVDDDDDHSIEEVVKILRRSTGCTWKV